jgi:hypothetical protein
MKRNNELIEKGEDTTLPSMPISENKWAVTPLSENRGSKNRGSKGAVTPLSFFADVSQRLAMAREMAQESKWNHEGNWESGLRDWIRLCASVGSDEFIIHIGMRLHDGKKLEVSPDQLDAFIQKLHDEGFTCVETPAYWEISLERGTGSPFGTPNGTKGQADLLPSGPPSKKSHSESASPPPPPPSHTPPPSPPSSRPVFNSVFNYQV